MKSLAKRFSIIELMTVVFIIVLLMTLMIPTFVGLKTNAKTVLCKSQLRQIGVLFNTYASDNSGYLPNDLSTDIVNKSNKNSDFYKYWNGHLLPYMDTGLSNFHRSAKLRNDGEIWAYGSNGLTKKPLNIMDDGWAVINDACHKGGFNDLKSFICPEIATSTFDVGFSNAFNGLKVPRINELGRNGDVTSGYYDGGVPTTYIAHDVYFGFDGPYMGPQQSKRIDQINNIGDKAFLLEGGITWAKDSNGEPGYVYYRLKNTDFGYQYLTVDHASPTKTGFHKLNYVHDDNREAFWIMKLGYYDFFPFDDAKKGDVKALAEKFNIQFKGKAEMLLYTVYSYSGQNYTIISYVDPATKPFDGFFNKNAPGVKLLPFELFESDFHYLNGNMNVLFGDNSVVTKSQAWLIQNRNQIGDQPN